MRKIDHIFLKIIEILSNDGRIGWRPLAKSIGISPSAIIKRVRKLERLGYIRSYTAIIDESKVGKVAVFFWITLDSRQKDVLLNFERKVARRREVVCGTLISGNPDYVLHAMVDDLSNYRNLLNYLDKIKSVRCIQSSFSMNVFLQRSIKLTDC